MSQDWLALQIALAPCLIGYGEIAKRLYADPNTKREGNIYWKWIENYVADDYTEAVEIGSSEPIVVVIECLSLTDGRLARKECRFTITEPDRRPSEDIYSCYKGERRYAEKISLLTFLTDGNWFLGYGRWQYMKEPDRCEVQKTSFEVLPQDATCQEEEWYRMLDNSCRITVTPAKCAIYVITRASNLSIIPAFRST